MEFKASGHEKLQLKLQACGISGQLLSLMLNFLRGRSQVTKVGREISRSVLLTSGVVQGSCLVSMNKCCIMRVARIHRVENVPCTSLFCVTRYLITLIMIIIIMNRLLEKSLQSQNE